MLRPSKFERNVVLNEKAMNLTKTQKTEKIWNIQFKDSDREKSEAAKKIARFLGVSETLAKLIFNRGYTTPEAARDFLCLEDNVFHDPFLLNDMDKAVDRLERALASHEKIMVYGDYDADGVTATTALYLYLSELGADVSYYIPSRTGDGYGVSSSALEEFSADGVTLMITVDTGITAIEEIEYAKTLGIDTIVTDHHECQPRIPDACAVVNPKRLDSTYPFKELAGVGVVFKFICAYETMLCEKSGKSVIDSIRTVCNKYADIISIGTVADVMPLKDENRLIVSYGLKMIEKTDKHGLAALIEASGTPGTSKTAKKKISTGFIGYTLAPRINAAGRMSSASLAAELLLTDSDEKAKKLAEELCEINRLRQVEENKIADSAYEKIEAEHDFENDYVIVVDDDGWRLGIIGIVASKITEKYGLPSIIVSFEGNGEEPAWDDNGKGSGRSIKGFNLSSALVHCGDLLEKYGGHELAAGLTVKRSNLEAFKRKINEYAREQISDGDVAVTLDADCVLSAKDITLELAAELYRLEPYGTSNPTPVFMLEAANVVRITPIGAGKHTKLALEADGVPLTALCFGHSPFELDLYEGDTVDLFFNLDINEFRGTKSTQLIVKDIKKRRTYEDELPENRKRYEEIKNGANIYECENAVPVREDFVCVYKTLRAEAALGHDMISHKALLSVLSHTNINYIKLKFIIEILDEMELVKFDGADDMYRFSINLQVTKIDLEESKILNSLRQKLLK